MSNLQQAIFLTIQLTVLCLNTQDLKEIKLKGTIGKKTQTKLGIKKTSLE